MSISRNKTLALAALGFCLLLPGQAGCAASEKTPPPNETMEARFTQMDTNGDGKVVLEEFRAAFPNMNEKGFAVIDANADNGIDRAEWIAFVENHGRGMRPREGAPMNNMPGDPLIPPPDSADLPLMRPPQ